MVFLSPIVVYSARETGLLSPSEAMGSCSASSNVMLPLSLNGSTGGLSDAPSHVSRAVLPLSSWTF